MLAINVTEFRSHLPKYLSIVQRGKEIALTLHGEIIARLLPTTHPRQEALEKLKALRKTCKIGDVTSPIAEYWNADK